MFGMFFTRFIVSSLITSAFMLAVLLLKKVFKKHISMRWHYNIWIVFLLLLTIPFIPLHLVELRGGLLTNPNISAAPDILSVSEMFSHTVQDATWLRDFTFSMNRLTPEALMLFFEGVWLGGIAVYGIATVICNRGLRNILQSGKTITDPSLQRIVDQCKSELRITKKLTVKTSIRVHAPMVAGVFRPHIMLPAALTERFTDGEIRHALLHEMTHYKNKDVFINYLMCIFQILYWFNPLVYLVFKEMRTDREIACDMAVLKHLPINCHIEYGKTIISFADKLSKQSALRFSTEMCGSKTQIRRRIEKIADYTQETVLLRAKSICIFSLVTLIMLCQVPLITALATPNDHIFDFTAESVVYEDLSIYFGDFEGSFVLYDAQSDSFCIHNKEASVRRVSPTSTYKIYSALIALEEGVITPDNSNLLWDGTQQPYEEWSCDQDLRSAMRNSVTWYFQGIDAQTGMPALQKHLTSLGYGNCDLSGGIQEFWLGSSLLISPVEQVLLLEEFYNNQKGYDPINIETVKGSLKLMENGNATLSAKTGSSSVSGKNVNGWFIGYVEERGQVTYFAVYIQGADNATGKAASQIALSILHDKGIYTSQ